MNLLVLFYVIVPAFLAWLLYVRASALDWSPTERELLLERRLELFPILDLLGSDDVRTMLLRDYRYRKQTFGEYSAAMRRDIGRMIATERLGVGSVLAIGLFYAAFVALWVKCRVYCHYRDIFCLSGLELSVFRSLQQ